MGPSSSGPGSNFTLNLCSWERKTKRNIRIGGNVLRRRLRKHLALEI